MISTFLVALGLSADAAAASVASGLGASRLNLRNAVKLALTFGFFQFLMPVIGWLAGSSFGEAIAEIDHWIAFALLGLIGGKMIYEGLKEDGEAKELLGTVAVLTMAIATSIDALAVGLSYSFLQTPVLMPAVVIGVVTFFMSLGGSVLSHKCGSRHAKNMPIIGGFILIMVGLSILLEHL